jgi:hypothetical protein
MQFGRQKLYIEGRTVRTGTSQRATGVESAQKDLGAVSARGGEMTRLQIGREDLDGEVTLKLEGVFNGETALQLLTCLEELSERAILLDFSRVHSYVDLAVAVLIGGLHGREVQLCGLPQHPERMFRYFGVRTRGPDRFRSSPSEELLAG